MVSSRRWLALLVALSGVLGACTSSSGQDEAADEPTAEQILADAAMAMTGVESAAFTIEQSGAELFIDDAGQLGFQSATGRYAQPSSADALITVEALGFTTEVGAIAIDGVLWFTNPLSGTWAEAPASITFDPALLFDADVGFPALLSEATATAELIDDTATEEETADGHHIRTSVSAERVSVLTGGLATVDTEVDLWIDRDSSRIIEARFALPTDAGVSTWLMSISEYGEEVTIVPPDLTTDS